VRRRAAVPWLFAVAVLVLLVSYVVYTQRVVRELQREAQRSSRMFATVLAAQTDSSEDAPLRALVELIRLIRETGIPLVVTHASGAPPDTANIPDDVERTQAGLVAYAEMLARENPPIVNAAFGTRVHFGSTRLIRGLRVVPLFQSVMLGLLLLAGVFLMLTHGRAERERMWAGMARESAHQIGTPLSSLHGWVDVLRERSGDPLVHKAIDQMGADMDRLERVAHRFERIGRPPRRENVDLAALVHRMVDYFRARVPTLTTPVRFSVDVPTTPLMVSGDRVLLEWALESLIKNAVDALSGVGGTISVSAASLPDGSARVRVADDGPGVPPAIRRRIFDAGFSTKERGWGIGLPLTRRIVEESHRGKLTLVASEKGAVFDVILRG
jgi:signal transduction histidine kinase